MSTASEAPCFSNRKIVSVILLWLSAMVEPLSPRPFSSCQRFARVPRRSRSLQHSSCPSSLLLMVMSLPEKDTRAWSEAKEVSVENFQKTNNKQKRQRVRKSYKRKRIPETEKEHRKLRKERQAKYEQIVRNADGKSPSIFSFESLFPKPVWDERTIQQDLYGVKKRDTKLSKEKERLTAAAAEKISRSRMKTSSFGGSSMMRVWRDPKLSSNVLLDPFTATVGPPPLKEDLKPEKSPTVVPEPIVREEGTASSNKTSLSERLAAAAVLTNSTGKVDFQLTRLVEDRIYGYRRTTNTYETSLMGDGAIKFREGVRLGNPLPVNAARLNYHAKKLLRKDQVEEAQELYERAIDIDPRDGRAYLGLSRCAERRRDFKLAREILRAGIATSVSCDPNGVPDRGANPFLLQALGVSEERAGRLSQAEALYVAASKSRPSHAAAWVALAQLRTLKFRQSPAAGRICYQTAERELKKAGMPKSAHVYTAWASLEYKKVGDVRRARKLFQSALEIDPKCSAAWLQLGVMEADNQNWKDAEKCFEKVLSFDQRNSRVLQAYAIMETKRPDSKSRKAIELFERALKAKPRDGGVYQAYALYVATLGEIDAARDLLKRGTEVDKRHAPLWQAWGVLETRYGEAEVARKIFQQGIWECAQLTGGQSGGYSCARLWQAWGVLEAKEKDDAAARRCFSRALDADNRSVAAIIAWTQMEEEIGHLNDASHIFEQALKQFVSGSDEKMMLWRAYELMWQRAGEDLRAQEVYSRAVGETLSITDESISDNDAILTKQVPELTAEEKARSKEVEFSTWDGGAGYMHAEVWMNNGSIEGMVPKAAMKKKKQNPKR